MNGQCVITGCALVTEHDGWLAGDLFQVGDVFVFNGNHVNGRAAWIVECEPHYTKQLRLDRPPFNGAGPECRGIFVAPQSAWILNEAAREYLA